MPQTRRIARLRRGALALVAVLVLVGVQDLYRRAREAKQPVTTAEWIWAPRESPRHVAAQAFYLVRDFTLDERPPWARFIVLGDEEFRVFLNGRFLGGSLYREGASADFYRIEDLLQPGTNRLAVEVRSGRGGGGLLAWLEVEDAAGTRSTALATDPRWGVQRSLSFGQLRGLRSLSPESPAVSWGRPPIGRWGTVRIGDEKPVPSALAGAGPDRRITEFSSLPHRNATVDLDLGKTMSGYLSLEMTPGSARFAKIVLAEDPAALELEPEEAGTLVLMIGTAAEDRWQDALPRRFRYARIHGLDGLEAAVLSPVPPSLVERLEPPPLARGVFDVQAPPLQTPLDNAVASALRASP